MGLNDGNELDHELKNEDLFHDVTAGEWPELEAEVKLVVAYEDQIHDLSALADDIEKLGGINQDFVLEAERLVPGILVSDKVPLGFYSVSTSATRYKVSLEEVSKGIWALIAAGVAAALAVVYKLYKWFTGDSSDGDGGSGGGGGSSSAETAVNTHEAASDVANEVKRIMESDGRVKTSDGDSLQNVARDLQVRRDTKIYSFLHEQNEALSELLGDKGLHHVLENLCGQMPSLMATFAGKKDLITKMITEDQRGMILAQKDMHSKGTELYTPMDKRIAMQPIMLKPLSQDIKGSLHEITKQVKDDFDTKFAQPHKIGDNYDTVLRNLAKAMTGRGIIETLKKREEWTAQIEKFQEDMEFYNANYVTKPDNGADQPLSVELAEDIRNAITAVLRDITDISRLHQLILKASKMLSNVCVEAIGATESLISELKSRAKNGNYDIPEEVTALEAKLKEMRKEVTDAKKGKK